MRTVVVATAIGMSVIGLSTAADTQAAIRRTDIPAQPLRPALQQLSKDRDLQLVFRTDVVGDLRTGGAVGELTTDEALMQLLDGTGLSYRYLDEKTVTVFRMDAASGSSGGGGQQNSLPAADSQQSQASPPANRQRIELEEIVVTGTHLRGATEVASPVYVYDREDIARSGEPTVARFLAKLPQNFGGQSDLFDSDTFGENPSRGSGVNLRGLGLDSTLVLVDGHRIAKSGSAGTYVDISGIPASAVERIDVQTDGASAIYGADAVGGVVNFITRRDYDGQELTARLASTTEGGYEEGSFSASLGRNWGTGRLFATAEYFSQSSLFYSEREFTRNSDFTALGGSSFRVNNSSPATVTAADGRLDAVSEFLGRNVRIVGLPASSGVPSVQQISQGADVPNRTNNFEKASLTPQIDRISGLFIAEQDIGRSMTAYLSVLAASREMDRTSFLITSSVRVPAANPYNFFGEAVDVAFITPDRAVRYDRATVDMLNLAAGLRGTVFKQEWNWSASLSAGKDETDNVSSPLFNSTAIAAAANRTTADALNPFGYGPLLPQNIATSIYGENILAGESKFTLFSGLLEGPLATLAGETIRATVGVEAGKDEMRSIQTATNLVPLFTRDRRGSRDSMSAFVEARLPFHIGLGEGHSRESALSVAGRLDDYSDFGSSFSPQFGLLLAPWDFIAFRGTKSRSFKAPLLKDLNEPLRNVTIADADPARGGQVSTFDVITGGSPDLGPEEADSYSFGLTLTPPFVQGLSIASNYFDIDYRGKTIRPNYFELLMRESTIPAGIILRQPSVGGQPGALISVDTTAVNFAKIELRGLDTTVEYEKQLDNVGLAFSASWTHVFDYDVAQYPGTTPVNVVDTLSNPFSDRLRGIASVEIGAMSFAGSVNYSSARRNTFVVPAAQIDSYTTFDSAATLDLDRTSVNVPLKVSLNAINLTDEAPPFVNRAEGVDLQSIDPRGRIFMLTLSSSF